MLHIRKATINDLDALCEIEQQAFSPVFYHLSSKNQYKHLLTKGNCSIWLAEKNGAPCGAAVVFFRQGARVARLYSIAVLPAFQGADVGKQLFMQAEAEALQRGLQGMTLEIRADNTRHEQRYGRLGYKSLYRVANYYPDGAACIKMRRTFL